MSEYEDVIQGLMNVRLPYLPDSKAYVAITNAIELIKKQAETIDRYAWEDGEPR